MELCKREMRREAVWVQLRGLFKMVDRGVDITRQCMSNSQKYMSIRKSGRVLDASGQFSDRFRSLSELKVSQALLKVEPGFDRYCRGGCALERYWKFHDFSFF